MYMVAEEGAMSIPLKRAFVTNFESYIIRSKTILKKTFSKKMYNKKTVFFHLTKLTLNFIRNFD